MTFVRVQKSTRMTKAIEQAQTRAKQAFPVSAGVYGRGQRNVFIDRSIAEQAFGKLEQGDPFLLMVGAGDAAGWIAFRRSPNYERDLTLRRGSTKAEWMFSSVLIPAPVEPGGRQRQECEWRISAPGEISVRLPWPIEAQGEAIAADDDDDLVL